MPYEGVGPQGQEGHMEMEAEIGGILPSARDLLPLQEARRGQRDGPADSWDSQLLSPELRIHFCFNLVMVAPGKEHNRYVTQVQLIRISKQQPGLGALPELRAKGKSYLLPMRLLSLWDGVAGNLSHVLTKSVLKEPTQRT